MTIGGADFVRLAASYAVVFLTAFAVSWLLVGGVVSACRGVPSFALAFSTSLFLALLFHYLLQRGIRAPAYVPFQGGVVSGTVAFQVVVLTTLIMVIYLVVNRYVLATGLAVVSLGI